MAKTIVLPHRDTRRAELPNGVTVLTERVPKAKVLSLGVWAEAGSRYEELKESGMTHFIQRLAFYGTEKRTAKQITKDISSLGAEVSLETGRDYAAYLANTTPAKLTGTLDLLADISLHPTLTDSGCAAEQEKLLGDLRADDKDADTALERMFLRSLWKGHGLSRPPHGRLLDFRGEAKVETFKPKSLQSFHKRSHHPRGLTVTAAGDLDHDKLLKLVDKLFAPLEEPAKPVSTLVPATRQFLALRNRSSFPSARFRVGTETCAADNPQSEAAAVLNSIIGEGPGSRLARLIRAKKLAAQAASSSLLMFSDTGCFSVPVRTSHANISQAIKQVVHQLRDVATTPVTPAEITRAKAFRRDAIYQEVTSPPHCIASLAREERYFQRIAPLEERVDAIEEVTAAKLRSVASQWFTPYSLSLAVLGKLDGVEITSANLRW